MKIGGPKTLAGGIGLILFMVGARVTAAPTDEPDASDTMNAPYPGDESGRIDDTDDPTSVKRAVGRSVLLLPRLVLGAVFAPVRLGVWVFDRYQLGERYKRVFFNKAETAGLLPVARIDSGFGLNAGAKVFHRDLFGGGERISAQASGGGRFKSRYLAAFETGDLFDRETRPRAALELGGHFEDCIRESFYGVGNDALGTKTRYRKEQLRAQAALGVRIAGDFYIRTAGTLTKTEYGPANQGGDPSIEMVYPTSSLTGFDNGVRDAYGELELRYDSRRHAKWEPPAAPSTGWLASVFAGRDHQFGMAGDYWRYGADLQRFIRIGVGPRTLIARVRGEAVDSGDVAFSELPMLGGSVLLRGYPTDRFRDRVTALGTLEYQWDLNRFLAASLFVDAGRVAPAIEDMKSVSVDDLRVGYGVGVQFHTTRSFIGRAHVATSKDGGVFVNLSFDPVFDPRPRESR